MLFLSVISLGFLLLREAKLFSVRENFTASCGSNFYPFILRMQRYGVFFGGMSKKNDTIKRHFGKAKTTFLVLSLVVQMADGSFIL